MFKTSTPLLERILTSLLKLPTSKFLQYQNKANHCLMTQHIINCRLLENDPFCLIDVGASGGINSCWNNFGNCLKAIGFEPLIDECERLNSDKNKPKKVSYSPYFIISDDEEVEKMSGPQEASKFYGRASAIKYHELKKTNPIQSHYNSGKKPTYTNQKTSLDRYFSDHPIESIDFIKIDTDGHDYAVLHGAKNVIKNKEVLGILVESQLHGGSHIHSNVFRNIDRLLTEAGFRLYNIDLYKYSRGKLPNLFSVTIPAQTLKGQMLWGDALYLRDYAAKDDPSLNLSAIKILKLACLYEMFELSDCAAELLITYQNQLKSLVDVEKCLNLFVKGMGFNYTYEEYMKLFEENSDDFFPPKYHILERQ